MVNNRRSNLLLSRAIAVARDNDPSPAGTDIAAPYGYMPISLRRFFYGLTCSLSVITGGVFVASPAIAQSSPPVANIPLRNASPIRSRSHDEMGEQIGFATLYLGSKQSDRDTADRERHAPTPTILSFVRRFEDRMLRGDLSGATTTAEKTPAPSWRDAMLLTIAYHQYLTKQDYDRAKQTVRRVRYVPLRMNVLLQLARSQRLSGKNADARATVAEAHALLPLFTDPRHKERALISLINMDLDGSETGRAEALIRRLSTADGKAVCLPKLASAFFAAKDFDQARRTGRAAQAALMAVNAKKNYDYYALPLVRVQCQVGDFLPAYTLSKRMHEAYNLADSLALVALHVAKAGGKKQAIEIVAEALLACQKIQDSYSQDRSRENIVYALLSVGDLAGAKNIAEQIFQPDMRRRAFEAIIRAEKYS
ncbi:MAG: hypothetical protein H8F28_24910 [Fibrella sp.]|nr:hypothetical protein [Armatimonadota bacterium]